MIKLFENFKSDEEIREKCEDYNIVNYTINPDKTISVGDDDVPLFNKSLYNQLPLRFKQVNGYFDCSHNKLTTLDGCPEIVGEVFDCTFNKLNSLVGGPKIVGDNYYCSRNNIMTFHGFPEHIECDFYCDMNSIFEVWELFEDKDKIELLNEMDPLRVIDDKPHVILDIFNDFLSIINKPEVQELKAYISYD